MMTICKRFGALPLVVTVLLAASSPALLAQPDLTVTDLQAPAEVITDARVEVSWTVLNQGSGLADASWHDYVYFSTNDTWEAADDSLGYLYHSADLAAGSNYTATVTVTVPPVLAGTYYLVVRTDRSTDLFEADETNNIRVVPWTSPPESPILSIRLVSDQAELSWPASAVGFELESAAPLGGGAPWGVVTNVVTVVGDRHVCMVEPSASSRFYRLRKDESP